MLFWQNPTLRRIKQCSLEKLTIKPQKVLERVKWQFSRNKKLTGWFNTLLSKKRKSIDDILYGSTTVQIGIYKRGSCFFFSPRSNTLGWCF